MQSPPKQDLPINTSTSLEPGIYVNIFPVTFPEEPVDFMVAPRGNLPDLRPLRKRIQDEGWNIQLYSQGNTVYGYGAEMNCLTSEGFEEEMVYLANLPELTAHLIVEGILHLLRKEGYETCIGKIGSKVFHPSRSTPTANGRVNVYQGYDLKSIFWRDQFSGKLALGLVIDATWSIRDGSGQSLNMHQIAQLNAVTLVAQIQGEYLPRSSRINSEVARQRLQVTILLYYYIKGLQDHITFYIIIDRIACFLMLAWCERQLLRYLHMITRSESRTLWTHLMSWCLSLLVTSDDE